MTHKIVKAKIKSTKWDITHERASATYGERRKPRFEIERAWPRNVQTLFARIRTGHAKELRYYRYLIETEEDPLCERCGEDNETIEHVLCHCLALELERR